MKSHKSIIDDILSYPYSKLQDKKGNDYTIRSALPNQKCKITREFYDELGCLKYENIRLKYMYVGMNVVSIISVEKNKESLRVLKGQRKHLVAIAKELFTLKERISKDQFRKDFKQFNGLKKNIDQFINEFW